MIYDVADFNDASCFFTGSGATQWKEIAEVIERMPPFFQASQQAGIEGNYIFDPKASNAYLNNAVTAHGWKPIPVPKSLTEFGLDWDGGKDGVLAEWQFSNYPCLWNNVNYLSGTLRSHLLPRCHDASRV